MFGLLHPAFIRRNTTATITGALSVSPVVLLQGPRQSGKSTLARSLVENGLIDRYITLDDIEPLEFAIRNPDAFIDSLHDRVVIDEVQRAPGILRAIKASVDRSRVAGRFLLTGSANVLLLPRLSETLAGRMRIVDLWPFAQDELSGHASTLVDALFGDTPLATTVMHEPRDAILARVLAGGYPPPLALSEASQRDAWFDSHVRTLTTRTVPDIARLEGLLELPRLMRVLASRTGTLVNLAEVSRSTGLPQTTLKRYLAVLQAAFLVHLLPAWTAGTGRRLIRAPRLWFTDTGFAASLMRLDAPRMDREPGLTGQLLETFVGMELLKLASWSRTRVEPYHFRSAAGHEVDIVLEGPAGKVVGIEIKASTRGSLDDTRGLVALAESSGDRFHRGVVLYTGSDVRPLGPRVDLVPIPALWSA